MSWGGLWLAVMTTPAWAFSQRTEKLSCGRRPRAVEDEGLAAEPRPGRGRQLAEMPREIPHVVGDRRGCGAAVAPGLRQVTLRCSGRGRSTARTSVKSLSMLLPTAACSGAPTRPGVPVSAPRSTGADGAPAHAAGAELEVAVEPVVQLAPGLPRDQLVDARLRPTPAARPRGRRRCSRPAAGIRLAGAARRRGFFRTGVMSTDGVLEAESVSRRSGFRAEAATSSRRRSLVVAEQRRNLERESGRPGRVASGRRPPPPRASARTGAAGPRGRSRANRRPRRSSPARSRPPGRVSMTTGWRAEGQRVEDEQLELDAVRPSRASRGRPAASTVAIFLSARWNGSAARAAAPSARTNSRSRTWIAMLPAT